MSKSLSLHASLAACALAMSATAFAQGTPPNPSVSNPALGAGQQTQQGTPMGTTGVPAANNSGAAAPMASPTAPMQAMPNQSATTMRPARADRN